MTTLTISGVLLLLLSAVILLMHGNATSNQAQPALIAQVYFDGEYRIDNGQWHYIDCYFFYIFTVARERK